MFEKAPLIVLNITNIWWLDGLGCLGRRNDFSFPLKSNVRSNDFLFPRIHSTVLEELVNTFNN